MVVEAVSANILILEPIALHVNLDERCAIIFSLEKLIIFSLEKLIFEDRL